MTTDSLVLTSAHGCTEGKSPNDVPRYILEGRFPNQNYHRAIRAKCVDCGNQAEVARCTAVGCALWPFRMGKNPFSNRKGNPAALKREVTDGRP